MRRLDQLSEEMKRDQHLARQEQDARQSRLAMEADGQASQLSEEMKMDRPVQRLGGRGYNKFVPVLGGNGTKIAPTGDILGQPPGQMR